MDLELDFDKAMVTYGHAVKWFKIKCATRRITPATVSNILPLNGKMKVIYKALFSPSTQIKHSSHIHLNRLTNAHTFTD